jgi:hypothetical protein
MEEYNGSYTFDDKTSGDSFPIGRFDFFFRLRGDYFTYGGRDGTERKIAGFQIYPQLGGRYDGSV